MAAVRLPLMSVKQLLNDVRDSNLIGTDAICDALKVKDDAALGSLKHRGILCT